MEQETEREKSFSVQRWRASSDLRSDIAHILVAIAILAGISTFDSDAKHAGNPETTSSVAR